jgi:hypothetical protein
MKKQASVPLYKSGFGSFFFAVSPPRKAPALRHNIYVVMVKQLFYSCSVGFVIPGRQGTAALSSPE